MRQTHQYHIYLKGKVNLKLERMIKQEVITPIQYCYYASPIAASHIAIVNVLKPNRSVCADHNKH